MDKAVCILPLVIPTLFSDYLLILNSHMIDIFVTSVLIASFNLEKANFQLSI